MTAAATGWIDEAAADLAHLGFVLRDGSLPGSAPGPRLLVAFRAAPTLEHFDPEEATFWVCHGSHCGLERIDRTFPAPGERPYSWGRIRVTDRIPVSNQFLTFGGTLRVADQGAVRFASFSSPAPIVRWAGHSQGVDPLVDEIGAFFGRLRVPVDYQPDAEARIGAADPEAHYAAFVHSIAGRLRTHGRLIEADPAHAAAMLGEASRLARDAPERWHEGEALLASLELG
jgi:hypothetical protein